jgi:transcriptional antiterminator RfaH
VNEWYTVFCKPHGEKTAETNLENQGYAVYLPRLLTSRRRAGKWVKRIEPLFPRYLFLRPRDARQSLAPVRSTLGVTSLVRFGGQPAVVPDVVVDALRAR